MDKNDFRKRLIHCIAPISCVACTSILSVLMFWANNAYTINQFGTMAVFLAGYLLLAGVLLVFVRLITRDIHKSALLVSLFLLLVSFFHPLQTLVKKLVQGFFYWHMLSVVVMVLVVAGFLIYGKLSRPFAISAVKVIACVSVVLVVWNLVRIIPGAYTSVQLSMPVSAPNNAETPVAEADEAEIFPNVYFLLFDEMSSNRYMKKLYGYDNSDMTNQLEDMGFSVSYTSKSEYYYTAVCTSNLVNLDYVYTGEEMNGDPHKSYGYRDNPPLFQYFENNGYQMNFYDYAPWYGREPVVGTTSSHNLTIGGKGVANILLDNTPLYPFVSSTGEQGSEKMDTILSYIDYMTDMENFPEGPYFNFSHFVLPHTPYIVDKNGDIIDASEANSNTSLQYYLGQYIYTTKVIVATAEKIIENDPESIVVLISDHSLRHFLYPKNIVPEIMEPEDMCDIFAAVYWGEGKEKIDIEGLHSVNIVRTLVNVLFNEEYKMIPYVSMVNEEELYAYSKENASADE